MSWAAVGILTGVQYMRVLVAVEQGHKYEMYPSESVHNRNSQLLSFEVEFLKEFRSDLLFFYLELLKNSDDILSAEHNILLEFFWDSSGILLEFFRNSPVILAGSSQLRLVLYLGI